jgi:hypothetical protein
MSFSKRNLPLTAMAVMAAVAIAALLAAVHRSVGTPPKEKTVHRETYRTQIDGLRFHETKNGKPLLSITADRFALGRGKIGFFSTGLTRKATLQNAVIDLYACTPPATSTEDRTGQRRKDTLLVKKSQINPQGKNAGAPNRHAADDLNFGNLFDAETLASLLPVRNIAEIEISPATIRLRSEKEILSHVSSINATILLRKKIVLFTGQVRVVSGDSEMTTEELAFNPQTSRLQTDKPFILKRGNHTIADIGVTTDIFLKIGDSH